MARRIVIIQGHPDDSGADHLCHALAETYARGARSAGSDVSTITVADLDFPLLRSQGDWTGGAMPAALAEARETVAAADHLVLIYPLWLGAMPALLKGFLEQIARPGPEGALITAPDKKGWKPGWRGKSARIVVTMGMPALVYRLFFGAHSLKSLERNILRFVGVRPVRDTVLGMVEGASDGKRAAWLAKMEKLGARGV